MSTRASASAVFPIPIEKVWSELRDFQFPAKYFESVTVSMVDGASPFQVGGVRKIAWKTGEEKEQRLLSLSDLDRTLVYETISANHQDLSSATITTIKLLRVTENNATFVQWSSDFAADIDSKTVASEQKAYAQNLVDLRTALSK